MRCRRLIRRLLMWGVMTGVLAGLAGCADVGWAWSHDDACRRARRENKRMLVIFEKPFDADCMAMDRNVYTDPDVKEIMRRYVPVKVNIALHPALAESYGIERVPAFVVVRPDGEAEASREGRLDAEPFRVWLITRLYGPVESASTPGWRIN